ncbi:MAG: hypothetical protein UX04_C0002G0081 [Microgenomates group bacterium GW2011_GWF2_45_18]|nr:MAG: hypothetical protein UW18_C0001G0016 [Microgenomates group bacterium GW2011_GWF1_44_10]KKU01938.1 MAG: hypothetical protein UX04_C0002G0081 [Microgenomates group bacterium GW2011_GWF2_45_18]OGJ41464.1 MAG: hypothetical protein A2378_00045 [Candidatus Pacebacteria bacterium RIFOXYB1_FULL_44_10]HAU98748.1 hypothetical protein [Candidatus Paceibacterota bacterium]HAX01432.1 hypothetical protein [Candidatus Paceibacterota bacterium]
MAFDETNPTPQPTEKEERKPITPPTEEELNKQKEEAAKLARNTEAKKWIKVNDINHFKTMALKLYNETKDPVKRKELEAHIAMLEEAQRMKLYNWQHPEEKPTN